MAVLQRALLRENFHLRLASAQHLAIWGMVSPAGAGEPRLPGGPRIAKSPRNLLKVSRFSERDIEMQVIQQLRHPGASIETTSFQAVRSPPKDLVFKTDLAQKQSQAHARTSEDPSTLQLFQLLYSSLRFFHLLDNIRYICRFRKRISLLAVCYTHGVENERPT